MSIAHRLKPNEISQDALPFYDEFDGILRPLSEKDPGVLEIITCNHLPKAVRGLVHSAFDQTRSQESSSEAKIIRLSFKRDHFYIIRGIPFYYDIT
ncbi:hypothetical protein [Azospirillum brasilense]|uniref:hypothetical protein n=1 Tax=Azospirillum brasilense TaxID=192 RepID=UPI001ED9C982|nr:hypothetical protein [Azospirillum brasilense]UKJ78120.1 hypothetical protein H1Q64_32500 [Azospirillum brasilense]